MPEVAESLEADRDTETQEQGISPEVAEVAEQLESQQRAEYLQQHIQWTMGDVLRDPEARQQLEAVQNVEDAKAYIREWYETGQQPDQAANNQDTLPTGPVIGADPSYEPPTSEEVVQMTSEEEAQARLEFAVYTSASVEQATDHLRLQIDQLRDDTSGRGATIAARLALTLSAVESAQAASGVSASTVHLYHGGDGELGHNTVGTGDVNIGVAHSTLLIPPAELFAILREVLVHEDRHGDQIEPDMGTGEYSLIVDDNVTLRQNERVRWLEAGTEGKTKRDGVRVIDTKPEEYDANLADEISQKTGLAAYERAETQTGDLAELQLKIWQQRWEKGELTFAELVEEIELTNYQTKASDLKQRIATEEIERLQRLRRQQLVPSTN